MIQHHSRNPLLTIKLSHKPDLIITKMQIFTLIFALVFAIFQAQGATVPAKTLRDGSNHSAVPDVTVKFMTANGTVVDAMPGVKIPQETFIPTSTTQTLCVRSDYSKCHSGDTAFPFRPVQ